VPYPLPRPVQSLLAAGDPPELERAWSGFLAEYSRLILHVARSRGGSYDDAMDRYAHVLEQLRRSDFSRLRAYAADGRGKFTTWLVVVVRRLCLDESRGRYGRQRTGTADAQRVRRKLADLVGVDLDLDCLPAGGGRSPEDGTRARELRAGLGAALEGLDPSDRLLLRLRFQDDVAVTEIAQVLSLPSVFHVYRRLNSIYGRLRVSLLRAGVEDARP
jgi:RNA polymerase sigma factor (sigma-70 family)